MTSEIKCNIFLKYGDERMDPSRYASPEHKCRNPRPGTLRDETAIAKESDWNEERMCRLIMLATKKPWSSAFPVIGSKASLHELEHIDHVLHQLMYPPPSTPIVS